jgi:hypothetical protein
MKTRHISRAELDRRTAVTDLVRGESWAYQGRNDPEILEATLVSPGAERATATVRFNNGVEADVPISTLKHRWADHADYSKAELGWFGFTANGGKPSDAEFDAATRVIGYFVEENVANILDGRGRGGLAVTDRHRLVHLAGMTLSDLAGKSPIKDEGILYYPWEVTRQIVVGLLAQKAPNAQALVALMDVETLEIVRPGTGWTLLRNRRADAARTVREWIRVNQPEATAATTGEISVAELARILGMKTNSTDPADDHLFAQQLLESFSITSRV